MVATGGTPRVTVILAVWPSFALHKLAAAGTAGRAGAQWWKLLLAVLDY